MFIGAEATTDYWVTFHDLAHLQEWGRLEDSLINAYKCLSQNKGEEEVIDHISEKKITQLLETLAAHGITIENALGGNAALEVMAGKAQGLPVTYYGALPQLDISKTELDILKESFVGEILEKTPHSLVIQVAQGTSERYILNKGSGHRANDVLPSFLKAKTIIKGKDILLGLVGVHVLFGTKRWDLLKTYRDALIELHRNVGMVYSDTGGFSYFTPNELKVLFEHIYANVDALALNEVELLTLYNAYEGPGVVESPVDMLAYFLEHFENLHTIWLHTTDVHITLSNIVSPQKMEDSMKKAAAAGCFRVETGKPPTKEEIRELIRIRQVNPNGIKTALEIKRINRTNRQHANIAVWPSYQAEKFTTSVGAGDTACVTYFGNFIRF
jgi:hypothetical protein